MADKFSLEDIVAEYSNKSAVGGNENDDISVDEIVEEANEEILNTSEMPVIKGADEMRESIFTAKETESGLSGREEAVQASAVIEDNPAEVYENPARRLS